MTAAKQRALSGCAVALVGLVGLWRAVPLEPLRSGRVLPLSSGRVLLVVAGLNGNAASASYCAHLRAAAASEGWVTAMWVTDVREVTGNLRGAVFFCFLKSLQRYGLVARHREALPVSY